MTCASGARSPTSSRKTVPPWATVRRPGCRSTAPVNAPRSWPKSSLSEELPGQAPAVDRLEPGRAPPAQLVDCGGHQLLARAGLAQDQHGDVEGGDSFDPLEDQPHRGALTDQAVEGRKPLWPHGSPGVQGAGSWPTAARALASSGCTGSSHNPPSRSAAPIRLVPVQPACQDDPRRPAWRTSHRRIGQRRCEALREPRLPARSEPAARCRTMRQGAPLSTGRGSWMPEYRRQDKRRAGA